MLLFPISLLLVATSATQATLASLRSGTTREVDPVDDPFTAFTNTIGLPRVLAIRHRFAQP